MASVSAASAAVAARLGVPFSRVESIARRLVEAGHLPSGNNRNPPHISATDLAGFVLTVLAEPKLKDVAATFGVYRGLTLEGVCGSILPDYLRPKFKSAAEVLSDAFTVMAGAHHRDDAPAWIEVVTSWPEVVVGRKSDEKLATLRYGEPGHATTHWRGFVRRCTQVSGSSLAFLAKDVLNGWSR